MGPWPRFPHPQLVEKDEKVVEKECIKLAKVGSRGYIRMGEVKILMHYFLMPKVEDMSMVYNRILSGLNSAL